VSKYNQASKLAEIGAQLKQMREGKDISLNQVTASTLIAERHLKAIEEGNLDMLPEAVYIQGFIRKYSSAVGLEGLAEEFPVAPSDNPKKWSGTPAAELRPLHLYALYILVIAGSVSILSTFLNPSSANRLSSKDTNLSKSAQLTPLPAATTPKRAPQVSSQATPTQTPKVQASNNTALNNTIDRNPNSTSSTSSQVQPNQANSSPWVDLNHLVAIQGMISTGFTFTGNKPVNLGVMITAQSWVRVVVDNETKFEGVLSEGTKQTWSAEKEIVIRAGNAAGVSVAFNGKSLQRLGEDGEVVQQIFDQNYKTSKAVDRSMANQEMTNLDQATSAIEKIADSLRRN